MREKVFSYLLSRPFSGAWVGHGDCSDLSYLRFFSKMWQLELKVLEKAIVGKATVGILETIMETIMANLRIISQKRAMIDAGSGYCDLPHCLGLSAMFILVMLALG